MCESQQFLVINIEKADFVVGKHDGQIKEDQSVEIILRAKIVLRIVEKEVESNHLKSAASPLPYVNRFFGEKVGLMRS